MFLLGNIVIYKDRQCLILHKGYKNYIIKYSKNNKIINEIVAEKKLWGVSGNLKIDSAFLRK